MASLSSFNRVSLITTSGWRTTCKSYGLGDPWFDSGVNALSILGRLGLAKNLELEYIEKQHNNINKDFSQHTSITKTNVNPSSNYSKLMGSIQTSWNMGSSEKKLF